MQDKDAQKGEQSCTATPDRPIPPLGHPLDKIWRQIAHDLPPYFSVGVCAGRQMSADADHFTNFGSREADTLILRTR